MRFRLRHPQRQRLRGVRLQRTVADMQGTRRRPGLSAPVANMQAFAGKGEVCQQVLGLGSKGGGPRRIRGFAPPYVPPVLAGGGVFSLDVARATGRYPAQRLAVRSPIQTDEGAGCTFLEFQFKL